MQRKITKTKEPACLLVLLMLVFKLNIWWLAQHHKYAAHQFAESLANISECMRARSNKFQFAWILDAVQGVRIASHKEVYLIVNDRSGG